MKHLIALLLLFPCLVHAQFVGGGGRNVGAAAGAVAATANQRAHISTPYMNVAQVRQGKADTASVVQVINNGRVYNFRYSASSVAADNGATVIVSGSRRYLIDSDYLTPEMFGAKADGVTDDRLAIQSMLDVPNSRYLFKKDGQYAIGGQLFIKYSNSELIGNNATIKPLSSFTTPSGSLMQTANGAAIYSNTSTSVSLTSGSAQFTLTNAESILRVGDVVRLEGANSYVNGDQTYAYGHLSQIKSISGSTVTLTNPSIETFTATKIYTYDRLNSIKINSLNFDLASTSVFNALTLRYCTNSTITGGSYNGRGISELGIAIDQCINVVAENLEVSSFSKFVGANPIAYGISVHGHNITVRQCRIEDCKHSLTTSDRRYMSTGIVFEYNSCYGLNLDNNTPPMDYHGNARGTCRNNTIYSFAPVGMQFRDGGIDVLDNKVNLFWGGAPTTIKGIFLGEKYFGSNRIEGNEITINYTNTPSSVQAINLDVMSGVRNSNITIRKNKFNQGIISWEQSDGGLFIRENYFDSAPETGSIIVFGGILLDDVSNFEISKNTFVNRNSALTGAYAINTASNCIRGLIENNSVSILNSFSQPVFRLAGSQMRVIDNVFLSDVSYLNYIGFYTVDTKTLLQGNKRVDASGNYYPLVYTNNLPTASAYFLDKTIVFNGAPGTTSYTCKLVGGSYAWVLAETSDIVNTSTSAPTTSGLNSSYGNYKSGTTVFYPNISTGARRYIKLVDANSGSWDEVSTTTQSYSFSASGNGSSTTISIPHGQNYTPISPMAQATNAASAGISYGTADATNINIVYTSPPASGTNNLSYTISYRR